MGTDSSFGQITYAQYFSVPIFLRQGKLGEVSGPRQTGKRVCRSLPNVIVLRKQRYRRSRYRSFRPHVHIKMSIHNRYEQKTVYLWYFFFFFCMQLFFSLSKIISMCTKPHVSLWTMRYEQKTVYLWYFFFFFFACSYFFLFLRLFQCVQNLMYLCGLCAIGDNIMQGLILVVFQPSVMISG